MLLHDPDEDGRMLFPGDAGYASVPSATVRSPLLSSRTTVERRPEALSSILTGQCTAASCARLDPATATVTRHRQ
jgi:hypothetical protein